MTPEDTSKIVDAIDRNTATIRNACDWIFVALMIIAFFIAVGIKAHATPLLPPLGYEIGTPPLPPPNPHVQYWHTSYVPGPDGVLPVEVFAPRLVAQVASDAAVEVDVPEPGTLWIIVGAAVLMAARVALNILRMRQKDKELEAVRKEWEAILEAALRGRKARKALGESK